MLNLKTGEAKIFASTIKYKINDEETLVKFPHGIIKDSQKVKLPTDTQLVIKSSTLILKVENNPAKNRWYNRKDLRKKKYKEIEKTINKLRSIVKKYNVTLSKEEPWHRGDLYNTGDIIGIVVHIRFRLWSYKKLSEKEKKYNLKFNKKYSRV